MDRASIAIRSPIRICSSYCGAKSWRLGQPLVNRGVGEAVKWAAPRFCRPECDLELQGPENLGNPSGSKVPSRLSLPRLPQHNLLPYTFPVKKRKNRDRPAPNLTALQQYDRLEFSWSLWASRSPPSFPLSSSLEQRFLSNTTTTSTTLLSRLPTTFSTYSHTALSLSLPRT